MNSGISSKENSEKTAIEDGVIDRQEIKINSGGFDPARMDLLLNSAKALASTTDIDHLLQVIVEEVQSVIECEGAGVLLYDEVEDDFFWRLVQDKQSFLSSASQSIRIPRNSGVCGWVFDTGQPALVHDAANDPRLYRPVEDKSGFQTRNMICVPLQTREKRLGVLYALNKNQGSFNEEDVEVMSALASNVALALENASYYESLVNSHKELERLNRAKSKMLHHLSHELKTPLAIIEASLIIMKRKISNPGVTEAKLPFERIERNLDRLKTIEKQVTHIVEEKEISSGTPHSNVFDDFEDFIEIENEENPLLSDCLELLRKRFRKAFPDRTEEAEGVVLSGVFESELNHALIMKQNRNLDILFEQPDAVTIKIQPHILISILRGLVRNAIENTPDYGKIVVKGFFSDQGYTISVRDYGVGIPEDDQSNVFEGFYPIQETDLYSSGRPYGFMAGGTGADLLKMRIFSERIGFAIRFRSERCSCIPTSRDVCPGDIKKCSCCKSTEDCLVNGGTEFLVEFPQDLLA
ncbi:MAG: GAF domain-containing sensor histidine kinase [Pseudomonadota bacterium]